MFDPNRTLQLVKGALFDPEVTWHGYLPEAGDWKKTAILLTGPLIVATALIAYVFGLLFSGASAFGFRPTVVSTLIGMLGGAVAITIVAYILSAFAKMFGGKGSFALGLAAATLAFVPGYAGQALSSLPWIGWLLGLALFIYGLVLLWRIIPIYLEVPDEKRTPHYAVSLIASFVALLVLSTIIGGGMTGSGMGNMGNMGGRMGATQPGAPAVGGGMFGGLARQGELIAAAEEDRYQPPGNGQLTEAQVQEFIRVMSRTREAVNEGEQRMRALAERADADEQVSFQDFGAMMSGVAQMATLNTAEIEVVKSAGGNWAEHQWVKESLRTAWLQKDINAAVAHNYALYQEYEAELSASIVQ
jgi:hypothetical protein